MITDLIRAEIFSDASYCDLEKTGEAETFVSEKREYLLKPSASWAVFIRMDGGREIKNFAAFKRMPSGSVEAEIFAAVNGVYLAYHAGARSFLIVSDCKAVVDAANKRQTTFFKLLRQKVAKASELDKMRFMGKHVKAHTRGRDRTSVANRWCDRKAKEARIESQKDGGLM